MNEPKFGGNAITKHRPIWELARRNNAKKKRIISRAAGIVISDVSNYVIGGKNE